MLTYLPLELNDDWCIVFHTNNVVRIYPSVPVVDDPITYTDYYINEHYTSFSGSDMLSESVQCIDHDQFTQNVFYRYDLSDILISFTCIFIVSILLIYFALKCFFRGFFK